METSFLGLHQGRAHKLCIEPGNPHMFYTCGEDGLVQRVSSSCLVLLYNSVKEILKIWILARFSLI